MTQILTPRLIGREAELEQLGPLIEGVARGHGGFVLITGEAGIGKTRFVAAVLDSLRAAGVTCVAGGCLKELQLLPYAPAAEALRGALRSGRAPAPQHVDPYLLHLLPELDPAQAPIGGESVDSGAVRYRLAQAVCGVLEHWAQSSPIAVLLEDLHWADSATRELVPVLVRRAVASRLLIIVTLRTDEDDSEHLRSLKDLVRQGGHKRTHLSALTPSEVGEMISSAFAVSGPVSGEFSHALHERTNGNPFFIEELLNTLIDSGGIFKKDGVWDREAFASLQVPGTIKDAILRRVSGLPDDLIEMLRVASVLGQRFDVDTLARTVGLPDDVAIEAVRTLVGKQLLAEEPPGLRFRHALTRETIYAELLDAERARLHRRVAQTLEDAFGRGFDERAGELAHHHLIAGDETKARTYTEFACERALRLGAAEEAHTHLSTLLDLETSEHGRAALLRRMGVLNRHLGRLEQSITNLKAAAETYARLENDRARGAALLDLSMSVLMNGYNAKALELRLEALAVLEPLGAGGELALAYRSLGHHHMLSSNYLEGSRWSRKAVDLGTGIGAVEVANDARIDLATSEFHLGRSDAALDDLRIASNVAIASGWEGQAGRAHVNLGHLLILRADYKEAIEACRAGIELGDRTGLRFTGWLCRGNLCSALRYDGAWDEAEEVLSEIVHEARTMRSRKYLLAGLTELIALRADQGRWEEARQTHEELWPLCLERDELQHYAPVVTAFARTSAALGHVDEAWAQLEFLRGHWQKETDDTILVGSALRFAAELAATTGGPQRGIEWVRLLEDISERSPSPETPLCLAEARGVVEGALDSESAAGSLEVAIAGWRELRRPFDTGRALRLLGELLASRDDVEDAVPHLNEAAGIFTELGAAHELKLTQAALRRAGVVVPRGPHPSTRSLPGGLTAREFEVAQLVSEGRTNGDIANVLVISAKTAANHVGHILTKLGFSSRTEIARWVVTTDKGDTTEEGKK
ncbi:MAG TPA: AAA family ATPase [Actinomycetota bacterium]|nr:AAA family ATPase [Actinomycetota bacterium]